MPLNKYLQKWVTDPRGGEHFTEQRDAILAHDPDCRSLNDAWLPRRGGVSCDLWGCGDSECDVTFHIEGIRWLEENDVKEYEEIYFCECHYEKRLQAKREPEVQKDDSETEVLSN